MSRRDHFDAGHGNPEHSLDHILSQREQAEISGRALGGHLWDALENALGGPGAFRQGVVTDAWGDAFSLKNSPGGEDLDIRPDADNDDYPVVHLSGSGKSEGLTFQHPIGGPYMDVYHRGEPVDTIHMGDDKKDRHNPAFIKQQAAEYEPWDYE